PLASSPPRRTNRDSSWRQFFRRAAKQTKTQQEGQAGLTAPRKRPMQRVNIACENRTELACHRIEPRVYRSSRHRVLKCKCAGNAKRSQPREAGGKIAEALAEENAGRDQIGCVGAGSLRARVAKPAETSVSCRSFR